MNEKEIAEAGLEEGKLLEEIRNEWANMSEFFNREKAAAASPLKGKELKVIVKVWQRHSGTANCMTTIL